MKPETAGDKQTAVDTLIESGWAVVLVLLILFLFKEALVALVQQVTETVTAWIYRTAAGSILLRRAALRRYRQALLENTRHVQIPFRQDPLDVTDVFVPLRATSDAREVPLDATTTLETFGSCVVVGPPGAGKSMLLRHVTYNFAANGLERSRGSPIPVFVELYRLGNRETTLKDELIEALGRNNFPRAERFIDRTLESGRLLLLLDGLDELSSSMRSQVVEEIQQLLERHRRCKAVVTCRSALYSGQLGSAIPRVVELVEFSDSDIEAFLIPWEPDMPEETSTPQIVEALRDNPKIMSLARNPLLLTIIAHLYSRTDAYVLPHSRAAFFAEAAEILLKQWHQRSNTFDEGVKRQVLDHLALQTQETTLPRETDRRSIKTELAIESAKEILPRLGEDATSAKAVLSEIVERSGLLIVVDGGRRYQFSHLNFQEFFAAEALRDDETGLLAAFYNDPDGWREVVKLWCGLVQDCTRCVKKLLTYDPVLALEAVSDAGNVDPDLAETVVTQHIGNLGSADADAAVERALGLMAASGRGRARQVFDRLVETLLTARGEQPALLDAMSRLQHEVEEAEDDGRIDLGRARHAEVERAAAAARKRELGAARALAASYLSRAAEVLVECYIDDDDDVNPIHDLGDVGIPALLAATRKGKLVAVDKLAGIGTAQSTRTLCALVWEKPLPLARAAAWHVSEMFVRDDLAATLAQATASSLNSRSENEWVWQPFSAEQPALGSLAGRIAYLLSRPPARTVPDRAFNVDVRIALPVATVALDVVPTLERLEPSRRLSHALQLAPRYESPLAVRRRIRRRWKQTGSPSVGMVRCLEALARERVHATKQGDIVEAFVEQLRPVAPMWTYLIENMPRHASFTALQALAQSRVDLLRSPNKKDWATFRDPPRPDRVQRMLITVTILALAVGGVAGIVGAAQFFVHGVGGSNLVLILRMLAVVLVLVGAYSAISAVLPEIRGWIVSRGRTIAIPPRTPIEQEAADALARMLPLVLAIFAGYALAHSTSTETGVIVATLYALSVGTLLLLIRQRERTRRNPLLGLTRLFDPGTAPRGTEPQPPIPA